MSEQEKKNREEFFRLMAEHPELPVIAMVDSEIVSDDGCCRWMGSWGASYAGEYLRGDERIYFRKMSDEEAETAYRALPWVKAIIVNIDLPD